MKKYFGFILSLVVTLILAIFIIYVNSTVKDDSELVDKVKDLPYSIDTSEDFENEEFNINKEEILALKVRLNKHIKFVDDYRISEFDVIEKFSDKKFEEDKIYITEKILYQENQNTFINDINYIPMVEGSEYIVLLDSNNFEDIQNLLDYKLYNLYGPNKRFSKINLDSNKILDTYNIKYSELDDYIPVSNEKQKEIYNKKIEEIMNLLEI